jgi:sigma-B regulation protein RsbU (phosphoserine phosphatase)
MMRVAPPPHPHLKTALAFHPTYTVAGDFCDFTALQDGRLIAVIGDVSGKGIPASLLVSSVRGALRAHAECSNGPGELLRKLNRQIFADTRPEEFVTLAAVAFDPDGGRLLLASAGHEPVLLVREGKVQSVDGADLVLGIQPDVEYEEYPLALQPGDLLLLYTDGIIEARNFNDEAFGRERLHASVLSWATLRPDQVLRNIVWDVRRFVGLAEQSDDMTLVAVRVNE